MDLLKKKFLTHAICICQHPSKKVKDKSFLIPSKIKPNFFLKGQLRPVSDDADFDPSCLFFYLKCHEKFSLSKVSNNTLYVSLMINLPPFSKYLPLKFNFYSKSFHSFHIMLFSVDELKGFQ